MVKHLSPFEARRRRVRTALVAKAGGRPRLSVHRSGQHIYAQVIDDAQGRTLAAASSLEKDFSGTGATVAAAATVADPDEPKPLEPLPEVTTPVVAEPEPAPVVPEVLKTKEQLACEKRKGIWAKSGATHLCVNRTRDSGKQCQSSTQCAGDCLARSGTCSPFQPLIGCNEILDDSGRRMTQCLN